MPETLLAEVIGLLGGFLWVFGMHTLGKGQRHGFIFGFLGEVCMGSAGYQLGAYFLMPVMFVMAILDLGGWYSWDEEDFPSE